MTNQVYLLLDAILGHLPKRAIIFLEITGAGFTVLSTMDIALRFLVGIVTLAVAWYAIRSHRASEEANKQKRVLDELQSEKVREEIRILKTK
jgi:hypothetical protein